MGMEIPMEIGFPWESHENDNIFWAINGNVDGNGNYVMGIGITNM